MGIDKWKKEYENLSSGRLALLDVEVLKEFDNGMRLIHMRECGVGGIKLINLKDNPELENKEFSCYTYHESLSLYELGETVLLTVDDQSKRAVNSCVILNEAGEIVTNNTSLETGQKEPENIYEYYKKSTDMLFDYLEKNIKSLFVAKQNRQNKPNLLNRTGGRRNKWLEVREEGSRLVVITVHTDKVRSVFIYNTETEEVELKSYGAIIVYVMLEPKDSNFTDETSDEEMLAVLKKTMGIATETKTIGFNSYSEGMFETHVEKMETLLRDSESVEDYMLKIEKNHSKLEHNVHEEVLRLAGIDGYKMSKEWIPSEYMVFR